MDDRVSFDITPDDPISIREWVVFNSIAVISGGKIHKDVEISHSDEQYARKLALRGMIHYHRQIPELKVYYYQISPKGLAFYLFIQNIAPR